MIKHKLDFGDDPKANDVSIELYCYKINHPVSRGGLGAAGHMKNAIKLLFPEQDPQGRTVYVWHPWMDDRIEDWCAGKICTWWGPGASAKSTDAAMIALVDWYADPLNTTTIICSTTLKMLRRRIFAEVLKFHRVAIRLHPLQKISGIPFISKDMILFDPSDDKEEDKSERAGIFGFAIQQGDKKKAKDDIIGQHNRRIRILVDEAQHPDMEVAFEARSNLMKGCEDFKLLAFGNPDSRLTPLGRYSEPKAGWDSVTVESERWETKLGICHFYDGLKSPAIADPARYHFLIKQRDIDDEINDSGLNSSDYWQFARGFVRPEGTIMQIISETFAIKTKMTAKPEWLGDFMMGAGFDPSYSSGGDRRVLVPFQLGMCTWDAMVLSFLNPIDVQIDVTKLEDKTFSRQMADSVISQCQALGVKKVNFGMDTTGAQMVLADFIDELWPEDGKIHRCEFGGRASEDPVGETNPLPAHDVYANRVTELWFNVVTHAKANQIRNIPQRALIEFSIREILSSDKMKLRTTKRQIETKTSMKERTGGKSPDEADACCVAVDVARCRMGLKQGIINPRMHTTPVQNDELARELDLDGHDSLYLTSSITTV